MTNSTSTPETTTPSTKDETPMTTTPATQAEFIEQVTEALAPKARAPRKPATQKPATPAKPAPKTPAKKADAKAPAKKAEPKPEAPVKTPAQLAAEAKITDGLKAIPAKRQAVVDEERKIVKEGRKAGMSWQVLADALGMSAMGLRNRYIDLVDAK